MKRTEIWGTLTEDAGQLAGKPVHYVVVSGGRVDHLKRELPHDSYNGRALLAAKIGERCVVGGSDESALNEYPIRVTRVRTERITPLSQFAAFCRDKLPSFGPAPTPVERHMLRTA